MNQVISTPHSIQQGTTPRLQLLLAAYRDPQAFCDVANASHGMTLWHELVHLARQQQLFATLAWRFDSVLGKQRHQVPAAVWRHFQLGQDLVKRQAIALAHELQTLEDVFADAPYPCVLLKGVAYRCRGFAYAKARVFADIDLLIPREHHDDAMARLALVGVVETGLSDYDRQYYLRWSHQQPPLHNLYSGISLDLHHHIFPRSSRLPLDIAPLLQNAQPMQGSILRLPSDAHLFLHAAVHLFYQEESHKLCKDIIDLHQLFLAIQPQHAELIQAANAMQAQPALAYALDLLQRWMLVELPVELQQWLAAHRPLPYVNWLLTQLVAGHGHRRRIADLLWYLRGHWLKMGPWTLAYHMVAKSWHRLHDWRELSRYQKQQDSAAKPADAP